MNVVKQWVSVTKKENGDPVERGFHFMCPGCNVIHGVKVGNLGWQWNGSEDKPTISPSVLVTMNADWSEVEKKHLTVRTCHSFVKDGLIEFLGDCWHKLAGKTVPLEAFREF